MDRQAAGTQHRAEADSDSTAPGGDNRSTARASAPRAL